MRTFICKCMCVRAEHVSVFMFVCARVSHLCVCVCVCVCVRVCACANMRAGSAPGSAPPLTTKGVSFSEHETATMEDTTPCTCVSSSRTLKQCDFPAQSVFSQ